MIDQARAILNDVFGYALFRPFQQEIIQNVLNGRDTLVVMPTGGGKSLCYQIPALLSGGLTVVVSPLISLMKDQVEQLTELGVEAVVLNSTLSPEEYQRNVGRVVRKEVRLLYVAPETLLMQKTLALLATQKIDHLVIDEAHCISEWGHDFRPEYRKLVAIRDRFPDAVCMALTATATPRVQQDIKESLRFEASNEFIASFNRENLFLQIVPKTNPTEQTIQFLRRFPNQSGIVYCLARRETEELAEVLAQAGFSVRPYHAGLPDAERHRNQELFIHDDVQIMVATIAFGMGINKPNVRFVLHYDLPKNIESYYQQIGRAGRDGLRADCMLLFGYADIQRINYFINQKEGRERHVASVQLDALVELAESRECRRIPLLQYFGEAYSTPECGMCDNCLVEEPSLVDVTMPARNFLLCVSATGEMFGAGHVIDVLRGSRARKIMDFSHHNLAVYGTGREHSREQWLHLSRQFVRKGLLIQEKEFGSLKLTPKAREVIQGKGSVFAEVEGRLDAYARFGDGDEDAHDRALFELLRAKRKELADEAGVPPYAIFPDRTLIEMAMFFPQSPENLLRLHGVGSRKAERYGEIFLRLLHGYCREHDIKERAKPARSPAGAPYRMKQKRRHIVVGEEFNTGKSITNLQADFGVKLSTILNHLYRYAADGNSLRRTDEFRSLSVLSPEQRSAVLRAFDRLGHERLSPVFEALDGQVSYDDLHLVRLQSLAEGGRGERC